MTSTYKYLIRNCKVDNKIYHLIGGSEKQICNIDDKVGVKNPNYLIDIQRGNDATSNYFRRLWNISHPRVTFTAVQKTTGKKFLYDIELPVPPNLTNIVFDAVDARDQAIGYMRQRLDYDMGVANGLASSIELREFRGLISQSASMTQKVMKYLIELRRGRFTTNYTEMAKFASDAWLTHSFALSPLLGEAQQYGEALAAHYLSSDKKFVAKGVGDSDAVSRTASANLILTPYELGSQTIVAEVSQVWSIYMLCSYLFGCGYKARIKSYMQYGIDDELCALGMCPKKIIPTLWELLMFSWVADYFGTFGDYLSDTFYNEMHQTLYSWENKRQQFNGYADVVVRSYSPSLFSITDVAVTGGSVEGSIFERKRGGYSLPKRTLRIKTIREIGSNPINKLLNLSSVLMQLAYSNKRFRNVTRIHDFRPYY